MSTMDRLPTVMTAREIAEFLRVPESTVLHYANRSWLPGRQIGGERRFWRGAIEEWLQARSGKEAFLAQFGAFDDNTDGLRTLGDSIKQARRSEQGKAE